MPEEYGLGQDAFAAEFDFEAMQAAAEFAKKFTPLPKYPALTRDFAFVCDEALEVGRIEEIMQQTGGKRVEQIKPVRYLSRRAAGRGQKERCLQRDHAGPDRTLTDDEADKTAAKITKRLYEELGISLRS